MKRLIITLSMIMFVIMGYAQVTNVAEFRVEDATTAFGVNLPVGSKVYDIANDKYYVATAGVASTETLTTASASFSLLNDAGTDDQTAAEVSVSATGNISSTNVQAALEELQGEIDGISVTDDQTLSIDSVGRVFTLSIEGGNSVNFEDTNTQLSETEVEGFIDGTESSFDGWDKDASDDFDGAFTSLSSIPAGLSDGDDDNQTAAEVSIADAGNIITATNVEGALQENRTAIDANATDIVTNASNISANAADILTNAGNITTNTSNISTNATDIAALETIAKTVTTTIDITSSPSYTHSLTGLVASEGCVVAINGAVIEPNKYTLTAGQIEIKSSLTTLYEFDQIVVTYKTTL